MPGLVAIVGVDVVDERPGEELLGGVAEYAGEVLVDLLEVPVEPRQAEKVQRELEEPRHFPFGPLEDVQEIGRHLGRHVRGSPRSALGIGVQAAPRQADDGGVGPGGVESRQGGRQIGFRKTLQVLAVDRGDGTQAVRR